MSKREVELLMLAANSMKALVAAAQKIQYVPDINERDTLGKLYVQKRRDLEE